MENINNDNIEIDLSQLDQNINDSKDNIYKKDENYFAFINDSNKKDKNEKYFVNILNNNEQYIGVLTDKLKKELFGFTSFSQGDEYLGEISNEKKNGFGIYVFKSNKKDNEEMFIGNFENNKINGEGINIKILEKIKEGKGFHSVKLIKYICHIGLFENGIFKKGKIYIVDNNSEKIIQNGENKNSNGNEVFNIEKKDKNNICINKGKMKDGKLIDGFIINFIEDKIENKFYFKLKDNSEYYFKDLNDELKEKEIIEEYNKIKEYRKNIQNIFSEYRNMIYRIKLVFQYAQGIKIDKDFKETFLKYYNVIFN